MVVGAHDGLSREQIVDNIESVCSQLAEKVPGGIGNIKNMYIKSSDTTSLPLYIDFGDAKDIQIETPSKPKVLTLVDEVTTVSKGKVMIRADGQVKVIHSKKKDGRRNKAPREGLKKEDVKNGAGKDDSDKKQTVQIQSKGKKDLKLKGETKVKPEKSGEEKKVIEKIKQNAGGENTKKGGKTQDIAPKQKQIKAERKSPKRKQEQDSEPAVAKKKMKKGRAVKENIGKQKG